MRCPACRTADLSEIDLELAGAWLTMHACSACDTRWWDRDGDRVALGQVLHLMQRR